MSKSHQRPWITEKNLKSKDNNITIQPEKGTKFIKKATPKSSLEKRTASLSRWLHIYLSMISFAILLFFAVTGLTLNHAEWFADQVKTTEQKGKMEAKWVNNPDTAKIPKLQIVELLRSKYEIKGYLSDFRIDDNEVSVSFKGPGYSSDTFITRETGKYEFSETRMGLFAVMNDLHKGRDSGKGWGWLIDISAGLMTVVSLSGLILILFVKRVRSSGLIVAGIGLIACYIIYKVFVP